MIKAFNGILVVFLIGFVSLSNTDGLKFMSCSFRGLKRSFMSKPYQTTTNLTLGLSVKQQALSFECYVGNVMWLNSADRSKTVCSWGFFLSKIFLDLLLHISISYFCISFTS